MRRIIRTSTVLCMVGAALAAIPQAAASPTFTPLGVLSGGPLYSRAWGISGDGTTVVGETGTPTNGYWNPTSTRLAFRWTEPTGMQFVGVPHTNSRAFGVSHNGAVVVGAADSRGDNAFIWQGGTASYLLAPGGDLVFQIAQDVSDDGSVAVGGATLRSPFEFYGATWQGGVTTVSPSARVFSAITSVGGEAIITGNSNDGAAIWRSGGSQLLGALGPRPDGGTGYSFPFDVSRNGRAVVGYSDSPRVSTGGKEAFRWTSGQGMVGLGDLPGGEYDSSARAISANGGVVVGNSVTSFSLTYRGNTDAFYWTPTAGMQKLSTLLTQGFGLNLSGWRQLDDATAVDDSGLVIAGWGTRTNGVEEAFRARLQQQIYINWDDPIGTSFKVVKRPRHFQEDVIDVPGSWPGLVLPPTLPNGMTPDDYKDHVISELDAILAASGVNLDILDSRYQSKPAAALEVRFGPSVSGATGKKLLDGRAWDVGPAGLPGVDRFNSRWDGQLAVLVSPGAGLETPGYTADTIAHEVGHGLGLAHVMPGARAPNEVMDYDFVEGTVEEFNDLVSQIIEPPTATGDPQADTHNPSYHLKRYVLGEDAGSTRPGTWDVGSVTIKKFEVNSISSAAKLYNVTPGTGAGAGELQGEGWSNVAYFAEVDPGEDTLSFYSDADLPLSIYASSEPGDVLDIVFGTGDAENPILSFENLANGAFDGSLFRYDAGMDAYHVVGGFSGTVAEELTLWGDDPEPIPEPATWTLLATGSAMMAMSRRRRVREVRV